MIKAIVLAAVVALMCVSGCDVKPRKHTYIKTERGLMDYGYGYCHLGMLVNNDGDNMYDENSKPITCTGYIKLTKNEREGYSG